MSALLALTLLAALLGCGFYLSRAVDRCVQELPEPLRSKWNSGRWD